MVSNPEDSANSERLAISWGGNSGVNSIAFKVPTYVELFGLHHLRVFGINLGFLGMVQNPNFEQ